jgi:type IV pilus assembly protein PilV
MRRGALPLQVGASLVEVLVAMVIIAVGLLSLVSLQGRLQVLQIESYQRAQALILLNDMAARIAINRNNAADYVTPEPVGVGAACPGMSASRQEEDMAEWCDSLQGAGEVFGGVQVGAMVGGRGCVEVIDVAANEYLVTVAWQGLAPISAPPASVTCGEGRYDNPDPAHPCRDDLCRRAVTTLVRIADLSPEAGP